MIQMNFIGNVGKAPEQRESKNGASYTSFSVAVRTRDPETPEWVQVQVWGKLGEWAYNNIERGSSVWICGQGDLNRWENRDGEPVVTLNVRADVVRFAGPKPRDDEGGSNRRSGNSRQHSRGNSRRQQQSDEPEPF